MHYYTYKDIVTTYDTEWNRIAPRFYRRVLSLPAIWDFSFHHAVADTLSRGAYYFDWLRRNPGAAVTNN